MSENEIIKALKWLILNFPKQEEPNDDSDRLCNCINLYCQNAVDLINRQKAEIERLQKVSDIRLKCLGRSRAKAKSEAYKEFADRLIGKYGIAHCIVTIDEYDVYDTLKELTEASNGE